MTQGFKIDGHFIPKKYDTNNDGKLQRSELNVWLLEHHCKYENKKIVPITTSTSATPPFISSFNKTPLPSVTPSINLFNNTLSKTRQKNTTTYTMPGSRVQYNMFDGYVGTSYQSDKTGDCWLLTGVNTLMTTSWGRDTIKNAIKPDGYGGVTVYFKGASTEQKYFHISAGEFEAARKSGEYSSGDPDMLAIELAAEKFYDKIITAGVAYHDPYFEDRYGLKPKSIHGCPMKLPDFEDYSIEELLTGSKAIQVFGNLEGKPFFDVRLLQELSTHKDNYAVQVAFENFKDICGMREEDEKIHGNHAYMIKRIDYGKSVTLTDPAESGKDFDIPFDYFLKEFTLMTITPNPDKKTNIHNYRIDSYEKCHEGESKRQRELDAIERTKEFKREQKERDSAYAAQKAARDRDYQNFIDSLAHKRFVENALCDWYCSEYMNGKEKFNSNNIIEVFDYSANQGIEQLKKDIVDVIDYGADMVFNRKFTRDKLDNMIKPMVNALADSALKNKVNKNKVKEFKNKCYEYIDAGICFNRAEKIATLLVNMYKLIKKSCH